jgi:P pilus assembly chaperone PapD
MKRRRLLFSGFVLVLATLGAGAPVAAQSSGGADLNISPKRVVFSPGMRAATIYVFNRGGDAATYNISLTDRVMTPDGQVRAVTEPGVMATAADVIAKLPSAQPMLTFTPRRVTLQPGQSQVVRLRALRGPEMTLPEYHTHLTVTTVPPESAGETVEEAANAAPGRVVAKINTLFSISIAVIVRQGPVDVQGGLDGASYSLRPAQTPDGRRTAVLSVDLLRKGANSLYGDVEVRDAKAAKSAPPLGAIRGVGVYTEVERRNVQIPLAKIPPSGTPLVITLRDDDTKPGTVLATATLSVP